MTSKSKVGEKIQKFMHDILGWGYSAGLKEKDEYGFQNTYKCKYCDGSLTYDSTGALFHLSS